MKKHFFIFLLSGLMVWLPTEFVCGDEYNGVRGSTVSVARQTGGGTVGKCDGKNEHDSIKP